MRPSSARAALLFLAIVLRCWDWGNPVIHVDEQYYLLVGDRMLHGAVPFMDLWDRKPVGLFLLFAAMRRLPGDGILAYQLCATACAWATALAIHAAARRIGAADRGALVAGAAYLVGLGILGGRGGQAPVFYNLPVALAALLALQLPALTATGRRRVLLANGALACLFAGLAIQLKYTAGFEAIFVGVAHLFYLRRAGGRAPVLAAAALVWGAIGASPTIAAFCWYAAHGWAQQFVFANFVSIGLRPGYPAIQLVTRVLGEALILSPLIACAVIGWHGRTAATSVGYAWLGAALVGFLSIGTYFDHYALPLLPPMAVLAAPVLGRDRRAVIGTLTLMMAMLAGVWVTTPRDAAGGLAVAAVVRANRHGGCPYVFIGDTVTYLLADACIPTAYAFPNLLAYSTEQGATGIDEAAEVRRILAARPPMIVTSTHYFMIWNRGSVLAEKAALARDYRLVFSTPRMRALTLIYLRRDLAYVDPFTRLASRSGPEASRAQP